MMLIHCCPQYASKFGKLWSFSVQVLLKPDLKNFERYLASMWNECNCAYFEHSLTFPFFEIEMKTDLFQFWTIFLTFQKIFFFLMSKGNTFRSVNFPFQKLRSWICHLFSKRDSALSSLSILLLLCIHFGFCCDRWSNIVCDRPYHVKYL